MRIDRRSITVLLMAVALFSQVVAPLTNARAASAPPPPPPALSVSPDRGLADSSMTMNGSGFGKGTVTIGWTDTAGHQTDLAHTYTGSGSFSLRVAVPHSSGSDLYTIVAVDSGNGKQAQAFYTVQTPNVSVTISPSSGTATTRFTMTGAGWPSNDTVTINYGGATATTVRTDGNGAFHATFGFPSSVPAPLAGDAVLVAADQSNNTASATVHIAGVGGSMGDFCNGFWLCIGIVIAVQAIVTYFIYQAAIIVTAVAALIVGATDNAWRHMASANTFGNGPLHGGWVAMLAIAGSFVVLYLVVMGVFMMLGMYRASLQETIARTIFAVALAAGSFQLFTWAITTINDILDALPGFDLTSASARILSDVKDPGAIISLLLVSVMLSVMEIILTIQVIIRTVKMGALAMFSPIFAVMFMRPGTQQMGQTWFMTFLGEMAAQITQIIFLYVVFQSFVADMTHHSSDLKGELGSSLFTIAGMIVAFELPRYVEKSVGGIATRHSPLTMAAMAGGVAKTPQALKTMAATTLGHGPSMAIKSGAQSMGRLAMGIPEPGKFGSYAGTGGGGSAAGTGGGGAIGGALAVAADPIAFGATEALTNESGEEVVPAGARAASARDFGQRNPGIPASAVAAGFVDGYQGQRPPMLTGGKEGNTFSQREIPSMVAAAGYDQTSAAGEQFASYLYGHEAKGSLTPENVAASLAATVADERAGTTPSVAQAKAQGLPTQDGFTAMGASAIASQGYSPVANAAAASKQAGAPRMDLAGMSGADALSTWAASRPRSDAAAGRGQNIMAPKEMASFATAVGHPAGTPSGEQLGYYMEKHEKGKTLTAENLAASVDATNLDAAAGATPDWGLGIQTQSPPTAAMADAFADLSADDAARGWSANHAALAATSGSGPGAGRAMGGGGAMGGTGGASRGTGLVMPPKLTTPSPTSSATGTTGTTGGATGATAGGTGATAGGTATLPYTPSGGSMGYKDRPWHMPSNLAAKNQTTMGSWKIGEMAWSQHTRNAGQPGVSPQDYFNDAPDNHELSNRVTAFAQSFGYGDDAPVTEAIAANVMEHVHKGPVDKGAIHAVGAMAVEDQWAGRLDTPTRGAIQHKDLNRAASPRTGTQGP